MAGLFKSLGKAVSTSSAEAAAGTANEAKREKEIMKIAKSKGLSYDDIVSDIDSAKERYGVKRKEYISYRFFDIPEDKRREKASEIKKDRRISKIAKNTGWDPEKACNELDRAKEQYGILNKEYVKHALYDVPEEDWMKIILKERDAFVLEKISNETGIAFDVIAEKLNNARNVADVTADEFYRRKLWELTDSEISRLIEDTRTHKERRDVKYNYLQSISGKPKKEIVDNIVRLRKLDLFPITIYSFYKYGFIYLDEDNQLIVLEALKRIRELRDELAIDLDNGDVISAKKKYDAGSELIEKYLSEEAISDLSELIAEKVPDVKEEDIRRLAIDLECNSVLLLYTHSDYFDFHFSKKPFEERVTFLSGLEKKEALKILNPMEKRVVLDDKYLSYKYFKNWYFRDAVVIETTDDYDKFAEFMKSHKKGIKKPFAGLQGRGIEILHYEDDESLKLTLDNIIENEGKFILEELIEAHPMMKEIYPDSINTVRINTLVHNGTVTHLMPFFRAGTGGNIVDNGAQGGVMASIDIETGEMISGATAHDGRMYDRHPDTGTMFKGIKFPKWQEDLDMTAELALMVAKDYDLLFIGWDTTYTADEKWIIVEANGEPSIQLTQMGIEIGVKDEFRSIIRPVLAEMTDEDEDE